MLTDKYVLTISKHCLMRWWH